MSKKIEGPNKGIQPREAALNAIRDILERASVPPDVKSQIEIQIASYFSGPLPPPDILREYDQIIPGGAERLLARFEKQSDHRMELEKMAVKSQLGQSGRGQWLGFIITLTCLGLATFIQFNGYTALAITIASTTILGLASVFVIGKVAQRKSLSEKSGNRSKG